MNTDHDTTKRIAPMSELDFARLGDGEVAYIKPLLPGEADTLFPGLEDIPDDIRLYALTGADGRPLALTDSHSAALAHAIEGELNIASVH